MNAPLADAEAAALNAARSGMEKFPAAGLAAEPEACFHCGLPVPASAPGAAARWQVEIDGAQRAMCCPGCEAVAISIVESGFGDYYRTRTGFAASAGKETLIPPQLLLYDNDATARRFETSVGDAAALDGDGDQVEAVFSLQDIRCAACVWLIERKLARLPGVISADVNVANERMQVRWRRAQCKLSDILTAVREIGYAAYPFDPVRHGQQLERNRKTLFRQLFVAALSMMQVMMYAFPAYVATDGTLETDMFALMRWAALLLTAPAVVYSAQPFFRGAWLNLKNRMLGMDVPVALGIVAAVGGSVVNTWRNQGDVYYDSITMFIFLLLCSRYLELVARRKAAGALDDLQHALPEGAMLMPDYPASRATVMVAVEQLREGDVILVKPGEAMAADGVIVDGETAVDLSLLTGESRALPQSVGAAVPGGAVNVSQAISLRVTRAADASTLSVLMRLIERAGSGKPQLALWADQVAGWFVAALLLAAVVVFFLWQWFDPSRAWPVAIAMLVVSCPCALSLATPTALAAATDRLVRQGILVVQPHVLETLHRATHIIFDKTGTLTMGAPVLQQIQELSGRLDAAASLRIAAALEAGSAHPLALAIVRAGSERNQWTAPSGADSERQDRPLAVQEVQQFPGQGLQGTLDGVVYRLGSAGFVAGLTLQALLCSEASDVSSVYLGTAGGWLARFDLADGLRSDAADVVRRFRDSGKIVMLLSGDQQALTQQVAERLGIDTAVGRCLPDEKLSFVQNLQRGGAVVAMVGDGINDAAVLRAADVSFAMGGGAALAQMHADCVLVSGRLSSLNELATTAARTIAIIRQNLAWATLYNVIAIPAAALGWLNPWLSGVGMSVSSAVVVLNALRLRRAK